MVSMFILKNAQKNLEAGFTTLKEISWVWDPLGGQGMAVRNAINMGLFPGPRLVVYSWIGMTGGHCDLRLWLYPSTPPNVIRTGGPLVWPPIETADGVGEVLGRSRQALRLGADGLKTSADSYELWGKSSATAKLYKNYSLEELSAMCDEAHRHHRLVSMHSHSPYGIKHAIEGGVDVIEHCTRPDSDDISMILKKRLITSATLAGIDAPKPLPPVSETFNPESPNYDERMLTRDFFLKKYKAGVRIAMGTDTCHEARSHGLAARGVAMMVEYGMSPMDAIVSTTKVGAEACDLGDQLGTLEKGKLADIILVDGDPLKNIQVLMDKEKIELVMKGGEVLVDRRSPKRG
jgi:imidazolonepropionase-like amidohydrolase